MKKPYFDFDKKYKKSDIIEFLKQYYDYGINEYTIKKESLEGLLKYCKLYNISLDMGEEYSMNSSQSVYFEQIAIDDSFNETLKKYKFLSKYKKDFYDISTEYRSFVYDLPYSEQKELIVVDAKKELDSMRSVYNKIKSQMDSLKDTKLNGYVGKEDVNLVKSIYNEYSEFCLDVLSKSKLFDFFLKNVYGKVNTNSREFDNYKLPDTLQENSGVVMRFSQFVEINS